MDVAQFLNPVTLFYPSLIFITYEWKWLKCLQINFDFNWSAATVGMLESDTKLPL